MVTKAPKFDHKTGGKNAHGKYNKEQLFKVDKLMAMPAVRETFDKMAIEKKINMRRVRDYLTKNYNEALAARFGQVL